MKTKSFNVWCALVALFWGLVACTPKSEEIEPATLSVSTSEIKFKNTESSQTINITTNQEAWVATSLTKILGSS